MLPVALGHLSFMAEVTPDALYQSVEQVLAGDCWFEARAMAEAEVTRSGQPAERFVALTGIPPMQYLTQWRVALAANLLRSGRLSLARTWTGQ